MPDQYKSMRSLRDNLNKLFELCGTTGKAVDIKSANGIRRLLEKLFANRNICDYLEKLDKQVQAAVQSMKDRHLDNCNNEQNEKRLEEQEAELEQLNKLLQTQKEELEQQRIQEQEAEPEQYQQQLVQLQNELAEQKENAGGLEKEQLSLIRDLITMRDSLLAQLEYSKTYEAKPEDIGKLLQGHLLQTARILESAGVEILDNGGLFDHTQHTVIETRPTDLPEQINQIAETFRPGYAFKGENLRAQEIILFKKD